MAQTVLEFRDVIKRFGAVNAVDGVSFSIAPGEVFTLLGPSGCGKTTTLRLVAGLEEPDGGEILIRGAVVAAPARGLFAAPEKRQLGMVFQSYAIWPHLSVFENVAFPLRVRKESNDTVHKRVLQALEVVGLGGFAERGATQLSGGQQQRVALARALVYEPAILLLDEPLGALDLKLRKQLQVELKRIQVEVGITFVYVTHDQEEALTMSDRIAVMSRGRVEQLGTPEELYERPATRFVADFIGTTNLLLGAIESVDAATDTALVRLASGDGFPDGAMARVFTRPEDVEISANGGQGANQLAGTIEQVAYLGGNVQYIVRTSGGLSIISLAPKAARRLAVGDAVDVSWPSDDALILAERQDEQEEVRA